MRTSSKSCCSAWRCVVRRSADGGGPKVYSSLKRRFSKRRFTIKTPQSSGVSSEDAVMTRATPCARRARASMRRANDCRLATRFVFPKEAHDQTHAAVSVRVTRYLEDERAWVMPVGITGTEMRFRWATKAASVSVVIRAGQPPRFAAARDDRPHARHDKRLDRESAAGIPGHLRPCGRGARRRTTARARPRTIGIWRSGHLAICRSHAVRRRDESPVGRWRDREILQIAR